MSHSTKLITFFLTNLLLTVAVNGQSLTPQNATIKSELIKPESYQMKWLMLQDSTEMQLAVITTEIQQMADESLFITKVNMPNATMEWVDSTIVRSENLAPIYHSSYNQNRDMVINFGETITGFHLDKKTNERIVLNEKPTELYFDSNSYQHLIRWLPLEENYTKTISIFDFNPVKKTGILNAIIKSVVSDTFLINGSKREVWKVLVVDGISDYKVLSTFFIDKDTRELLKQEIEMPGRKMAMELIDN